MLILAFFIFKFIRDELKHEDSLSRHSRFHGTDDQISVDDLWVLWVNSQGKCHIVLCNCIFVINVNPLEECHCCVSVHTVIYS